MSLTREIRHRASQPDPHGTRASRVKPNAAGRVGSGQEVFEIFRVGSARLNKFSSLAGRVGSGQQFSKNRGSAQVGSRGSQNLAGQVGSGQNMFNIARVGSSGDPTRPNPTREICPDPRKALLMSIFLLNLQHFLQSSPRSGTTIFTRVLRGNVGAMECSRICWRDRVGNCLLYTSPSPRD